MKTAVTVTSGVKWGVFEQDDHPALVHVIPLFGREHEARRTCFCRPRLDGKAAPSVLYIHEPVN